jgi:hypothetical protein
VAPIVNAIEALLAEATPLVARVEGVRGKMSTELSAATTARGAKPHESVSLFSDESKALREPIESLTVPIKASLASAHFNEYCQSVDSYMALPLSEKMHGHVHHFRQEPHLRQIIGLSLTRSIQGAQHTEILRDNYRQLLQEAAVRDTHHALEEFINKQVVKLAGVLNARPITSLAGVVSLAEVGLSANIAITVADGTHFRMVSQAVMGHTADGKPFFRLHTTFHDAVIARRALAKRISEIDLFNALKGETHIQIKTVSGH